MKSWGSEALERLQFFRSVRVTQFKAHQAGCCNFEFAGQKLAEMTKSDRNFGERFSSYTVKGDKLSLERKSVERKLTLAGMCIGLQ